MSIRVRMQPVSLRVSPQGGRAFTVVHEGTVRLESRGDGTAPAAGAATLEFFEVPHRGDTESAPRLIASIDGDFRMVNSTPMMDLRIRPLTRASLTDDSDFRVKLSFDSSTFENVRPGLSLFLPWEVQSENSVMEVGGKLTVAGSVVAELNVNDPLDIPLRHNAVPEDGTDQNTRLRCFGVGIVYPSASHLLSGNSRIQFPGRMCIHIHNNVGAACNAIHPGSFDQGQLTQKITTVMSDAGFAGVNIFMIDDTRARTVWARRNGRFVGQNIATPPSFAPGEGSSIPFFDYWIFHERSVAPLGGDAGNSEALNDSSPPGADKLVILPIVIPGAGPSTPFQTSYQATLAPDRMNFLADLITHEIGHSLGLRHGLRFKPSDSSYVLDSSVLKGAMTMLFVRGGEIPLKTFGPVHKQTIQTHFL